MFRKALAALFLIMAGAPFAQAQDYLLSPRPLSLVAQVCSQVMGLQPGQTYFAVCKESLLQALPAANQAVPLAAAEVTGSGKSFYEVGPRIRWDRERRACAVLGLLSDTIAFHQCAAGLDGAFLPSPN